MFDLNDFKPVTIDAKTVFDAHYDKYPPAHSEYMFSTLFTWMHFVEYRYLTVKDNLIIMAAHKERPNLRPPSGERNDEVLKRMLELARTLDSPVPIVAISDNDKDWIRQVMPDIEFTYNENYFDYIYLASDLSELPGKNYQKQRNAIRKFSRRYQYTVEEMCKANAEEVWEFLQRWCLWRDCESDEMLANEREAIMTAMKNCFDLDLSGICMRIGSNIEALAVYEEMNPNTAVIHFEKAMPDYVGIYQTINMETVKLLSEKYEFINRESDLGIPGLREAKKRYHPHRMEKVSYVKKEDMG